MIPLLAAALPSLITAGASIGSSLLAQRAQRMFSIGRLSGQSACGTALSSFVDIVSFCV